MLRNVSKSLLSDLRCTCRSALCYSFEKLLIGFVRFLHVWSRFVQAKALFVSRSYATPTSVPGFQFRIIFSKFWRWVGRISRANWGSSISRILWKTGKIQLDPGKQTGLLHIAHTWLNIKSQQGENIFELFLFIFIVSL